MRVEDIIHIPPRYACPLADKPFQVFVGESARVLTVRPINHIRERMDLAPIFRSDAEPRFLVDSGHQFAGPKVREGLGPSPFFHPVGGADA